MKPEPGRLGSRALLSRVLRRAATAFRSEWAFLLLLVLIIFVPLGFLEALIGQVDADELSPELGLVAVTVVVTALMGEVLYSGAVAALLAKTPAGEQPSIARLVRELAWGRLIAADVLVSLLVVIGLVLLIAPGVIFLAWFAFVAPVIEIEDRGLRDSFWRSRELVRGRFWIVLAIILGVTLASEAAITGLVELAHSVLGEGLLAEWLPGGAGGGVRHRAQHRQVRDRVRVGPGLIQVDAMPVGEPLHRLDLPLAVDERPLDIARERPVRRHLVAGPDPALEAEHLGEQLDERTARRADYENRAPGVLMHVDLFHHLRIDPGEDAGEQVRGHARDLRFGNSPEQVLDHGEQRLCALVGRAAEAKAQVVETPRRELAAPNHA